MMYHLTTKENALSILEHNFDMKLSKMRAFGKGANLTTNKEHLMHYYSKTNNYIVVVLVKYNKLKYNPPYTWKKSEKKEKDEYFKTHNHSKPTLMTTPKDYEGMIYNDIIIISNKKYMFPICAEKIQFKDNLLVI